MLAKTKGNIDLFVQQYVFVNIVHETQPLRNGFISTVLKNETI